MSASCKHRFYEASATTADHQPLMYCRRCGEVRKMGLVTQTGYTFAEFADMTARTAKEPFYRLTGERTTGETIT
jgi:hypothetical protein